MNELFPNAIDADAGVRSKRQRVGWERLSGGVAGQWRHVRSGWLVCRCGHPTAIWPYYGERPDDGAMLLNGGIETGHAFQRLAEAQAAVEKYIDALPARKSGNKR
jgi:hypothetical protein